MVMFSNKYKEEIALIFKEMLDNGHTKMEVIYLISQIIQYFIEEDFS